MLEKDLSRAKFEKAIIESLIKNREKVIHQYMKN